MQVIVFRNTHHTMCLQSESTGFVVINKYFSKNTLLNILYNKLWEKHKIILHFKQAFNSIKHLKKIKKAAQ